MRIINKSLRCVFPIVFFVIGGFMFTGCVLYKNKIMAETAKAIVHDLVWGGRATERAIEYGDKIIPLIEKESDDFRALNGRNALWIAEVLGATETEKAKAVLFELYSRSNTISRLTGAIGLAQQGLFPDVIDERSFLVQIVRQDPSQSETQLAIIALGRTRNPKAIPCLLDFLRKRPSVDYWLNAYACQAIARIGSSDAIPVLRDCLRSDSFYALPEALRTLISLGDKDAIPLAISRVDPKRKGFADGGVVQVLINITGNNFGYNRAKWQHWWDSTQQTWTIPQKYRKPYTDARID